MNAATAMAAAAGAWLVAAAFAYTAGAQLWYRGLGRGVVREGPRGRPAVALTFDDGPDPEWTERIASELEAAGARGTFFVLAVQARRHPDIVRRLADRGHEIALHGYDHRHLWLMGPRDACQRLQEATAILEGVLGGGGTQRRPRFYRPPWGHFNLAAVRCARDLGMQVALWSAAPPDWVRHTDPEALAQRIAAALRPGAIIDLHDGGPPGRARTLCEALPAVLDRARASGLRCVTLSELLREDGPSVEPGEEAVRRGEAAGRDP